MRDYGDDVLLVTGPPLGPEGSLLERARAGGVPLEIIPQLRRPIRPWSDLRSYQRIKRRAASLSARRGSHPQRQRRSAGPCRRLVAGGAGRHPHGPRRAVPSVPGQGSGTGVSRLRALGRPAVSRDGERGRRHDRADGRCRRCPAGKIHHRLQRHGGRAVPSIRGTSASVCGGS